MVLTSIYSYSHSNLYSDPRQDCGILRSQLIAALQSRDLWPAICTTDPTYESIQAQNPQAVREEMEEVEEALRNCLAYRQYIRRQH